MIGRRTASAFAVTVLALLLLVSPVGTYLAGVALTRVAAASGWQLRIAATSGWMVTTPTLHGVRCVADADGTLSIDIEKLSYSPWSSQLRIDGPEVIVTVGRDKTPVEPKPTEALQLPVGELPPILLSDGRVEVRSAGDSIVFAAEDVEVEAAASPSDAGEPSLAVRLSSEELQIPGLPMKPTALAHLKVRADRVAIEELRLEGSYADENPADPIVADASGTLLLEPQLPVDIEMSVQRAGIVPSRAETRLRGTLSPMALEGGVSATLNDSTLGEVELESAVTLTNALVSLKAAKASLLGGEVGLHATYAFAADSATVEARTSNLPAHRIGLGSVGGFIEGELVATARLSTSVYSGSLQARLQGARLVDDMPRTVGVSAELASSGRLNGSVSSEFGHVALAGDLDLTEVSYRLALAGSIDPTAVLGEGVSKLAVSGQLTPDDVRIRLTADEVSYLQDLIGPVGLELQLEGGRYLSASVVVEDDQARAFGKADLETGRLDTVVAMVSTLPMGRVLDAAGGDLDAHLSGAGGLELSTARVSGRIGLGELELSGWRLGDVNADVALEEGEGKLELNGDGLAVVVFVDTSGVVTGNATLTDARFVRGNRSAGSPDSIAAAGRIQWSGDLTLGMDQWEAEIEFDSLRAELSGYDLCSADFIRVHHAAATTTIDSARWHTPLGEVLLAGRIGAERRVSAAVDSLTPSGLVPELEGNGSAQVEFTGSLDQPRAEGQIRLSDLRMGREHPVGDFEARLALRAPQTPDSLVVTATIDQSGLDEHGASASNGSLTVRFSGAADAMLGEHSAADSSRASLQFDAANLSVSGPFSYLAGDSLSAHVGVRGELSLIANRLSDWGQARGRLEVDRLDFGAAAARIGLQGTESTVLQLTEGKRMEMTDSAVFPIERLVDGETQFTDAGSLSMRTASHADLSRLSLELEEMDLRVVEALSGGSIELPTGAIDGFLAIVDSTHGTAVTLQTVTYLDDFGELLFDSRASETDIEVHAAWVTPVLDSLVVTADAPFQMGDQTVGWESGRMHVRSDGINLFPLLDLTPQLQDLDGLARVDLEIQGLAGGSQVRGYFELEDARLSIPDVAPGYVIPYGAVRFAGDGGRGEIEEFVGGPDSGGGRLELSGFVDFAVLDDPDYELIIDGTRMPYRYEETFNAPELEFHLGFRDKAEERLLWGEINVDGAAIEPTLVNFSATTVPPPPALKNPFLESTALDLHLDLRKIRVKNELSDLMLEGNSRLYGTFYKPRLQGEIQLLRGGTVAVLSREFSITRGRIGLDRLVPTYSILDLAHDPLLLNPELDIEAMAIVYDNDSEEGQEEKEVVMMLSGTALQSEPVFTSAGLADSEVISLLAFGSTRSFRTEDLSTAAGQLLLRGQVSKVGLDEFALLPSGTVSESVGKTTVRVGKFFSFLVPIWVRYETPTNFPTQGEVELEYKLGSFLNINARSQSKHNLYGAGVGVKKSY